MRFLIIDNSIAERNLLSFLLKKMGHFVEEKETAKGLVKLIATGQYDSIFLDIAIPDPDGYKFLRTLRANRVTAKQHVIIYSRKKSSLEINYGLNIAKANDFLLKPVTPKSLIQAIEKISTPCFAA
ncbi:MAG: response regulator [Prochloraceae cyanobacterium]|nr:response regulator [Prochloraceae cyanobacterium]